MNVQAIDMFTDPVALDLNLGNGIQAKASITPSNDLISALPDADFISLHIPKQADGSAVISSKEFGLMKDGVRIINAARGGVIDENELITALDSGKVSYAGLDVFENEPNPMKELLNHSKIACTPHIGAATNEAQDRIGTELAQTIISHFGTK